MVPAIMRAIAGVVAAGGRTRVAAATVARARASTGSQAAMARAERRLASAKDAAARNDHVAATVANAVDKIDEAAGGLLGITRFAHSITVTVRGGPAASLRRCWFLCIAALFGRRKRGLESNFAEALNAQWDITGKSVTATLSYTNNALTEPSQNLNEGLTAQALLQRGPDQVTIGGGWTNQYYTVSQGRYSSSPQSLAVIGGWFRGDVVDRNAILRTPPGEFVNKNAVNTLNTPWVTYTLPPVEPPKVVNGYTVGWLISKVTTDNLPVISNVFTMPWLIQLAEPDVLAEMPIALPNAQTEAIPYTIVAPLQIQGVNGVDVTINNQRFVTRGANKGMIPVLPDEGRVITTGEKHNRYVQPPKPPVDGVSRGSLLSMVAAALASPGVLVEAPGNLVNNTQPIAAQGVFVFQPGSQFKNADQVDEKYRLRPNTVLSRAFNIPAAFANQVVRGLFTPFAVHNIRPKKPGEVELRGGVPAPFNPELKGK